MPSPSQDSEKLTDAVAKIIAKASGDALYNGAGKVINPEDFTAAARKVISEVSRRRTPSVPGEDVRERARKFVGLHHFGGGVFSDNITLEALREFADEIATLLSSTAALAREEAAAKLETMMFLTDVQPPDTGPFTREDRMRDQVVKQGAAAIRAIGKEG